MEYRFEGFRLAPEESLLEHQGKPVRLPPKGFLLLLALIEARGKLVSKAELTRQVWPDLEYVEPNTFDQTLFHLRKQLAEYGGSEYILTIPRRGYKWTVEVEVFETPAGQPASQPARRRLLWGGLAVAAAGAAGVALFTRPRWRLHRNPAAVRALEEGKRRWRLRGGAELYFREALRLEPNWAEAHAALASDLAFGEPPAPEAFLAVEKALALAPDLGEAWAILGFLRMVHRWDWTGAGQAFERALQLAPQLATTHHWYSLYLRSMGRIQQARTHLEEAARLDPDAPAILDDLGVQAMVEGRPIQAQSQFQYVGKRHSDFPFWKRNLWRSLVLLKGAEASFPYFLDFVPPEQRKALVEARTKGILAAWECAAREPGQPYGAAELWLLAGRKDRALDALEEAVRRHNYMVFAVKTDPMFAALRSEPRFHAIVKSIGLQMD